MKGEDKMKQTIMGIGLIVGVLVGFCPECRCSNTEEAG